MKTTTGLIAALLGVASTAAAIAATDPMLGHWQADLARMSPPNHAISSQTLMIEPAAAGGYTLHLASTMRGGTMAVDLPAIPDGAPHTQQSKFGPMTSTCRSTKPETIDCQVSMGGTHSQSSFALSADGSTLTETDIDEVVHEHYSSQASVTVHNTGVSQGPSTSQHQQTTSKETHTTVYRRQ